MNLKPALFAAVLLLGPAVHAAFSEGRQSCPTGGACCGVDTAAKAVTAGATTRPSYTAFGDPAKLTDADNIDAGRVLADVPAFEGKTVRMTGTVKSVCAKKGCWLKMTSGDAPLSVFVKFTCPTKGRLIPADAVGRPAIVEGKVKVKQISEADARHIAEEEGLSKAQIEAIRGPQKLVEVEGPSALVAM